MATHHVDGDHLREPVWIEIRTVLMEHWDLIGVADEPYAADEYEAYIPKIKALLRAHASVEAVRDYLDKVTSESMGFTSQRELARSAAEHLLMLQEFLPPHQFSGLRAR